MPKNQHLFSLVKSLDKQEKRYFILYASRHIIKGQNNYIRLFNAIDAQSAYDEKAIKQRFNGETFIRNLSATKYYLYKLILKSLEGYHGSSSVNAQLTSLLKEAEILFDKRLMDQSENILDTAGKLARRYDKHGFLIEIIKMRKKIFSARSYEDTSGNDITAICAEESKTLKEAENENDYWKLSATVYSLHYQRSSLIRDEEEWKQYEKLMGNALFQDERNAQTFGSRLIFNGVNALFYRLKEDPRNSETYVKKNIELFEASPEKIRENPRLYTAALVNMTLRKIALGDDAESLRMIGKLRGIPEKFKIKLSLHAYLLIQERAFFLELATHRTAGAFGESLPVIERTKGFLAVHQKNLNNHILRTFYLSFSLNYFGAEKYADASVWLNKIINESQYHVRLDIGCFARMINLVVQYELGNIEYLEYMVRSTYRFLKKRNRVYKLEEVIMNFIRKRLPSVITPSDLQEAFKSLLEELKILDQDKFEKRAFEYFDFISWLESKIGNRSFAELVREKANQRGA